MRRTVAVLASVFVAAAVLAGSAGSATSKSTFQVFVDSTLSGASNGLVLETEMEGQVNVAAKTASGDGTFSLLAGGNEIDHGTFSVTGLVAFQFYGCGEVTTPDGPITLPPNFCGGRMILRVHATSANGAQHTGLYEVNCQIHNPGGQAPPGTSEGVKVNTRGVNFNRHITGDNLFVKTP
jgi:hypothetical protein